jgi:hypothetical protein
MASALGTDKIDSALGTVYDYQIDGTLLPENFTNSTSRTYFARDLPFQHMHNYINQVSEDSWDIFPVDTSREISRM